MKDRLHHYFQDVAKAVDHCLEQDQVNPALILLYSTIDAAAWLWSDEKRSVQETFEAWVDEFMLPAEGVACRAVDLYAARCGMVHRLTNESNLTDRGVARPICYACREADPRLLEERAGGRFIVVHVEVLLRAFVDAIIKFIESLGPSNPRSAPAFRRARSYFVPVDEDDIDAALKSGANDPDEG